MNGIVGGSMKKAVVIVIVGILFMLPILAVVFVSNKEMDKYKVENNYDLREKAYGEVVSPTRSDIKEYYILNGKITSETVRFMKLPVCDYDNIRWLVDIGDEVSTGMKIGFSGDVKIYASCDGIVEEINVLGEESYVRVQTFDGLLFEAVVPLDIECKLKDVMYDKEGNKFTLVKRSRQYSENGIAIVNEKACGILSVKNKCKQHLGFAVGAFLCLLLALFAFSRLWKI